VIETYKIVRTICTFYKLKIVKEATQVDSPIPVHPGGVEYYAANYRHGGASKLDAILNGLTDLLANVQKQELNGLYCSLLRQYMHRGCDDM